MTCLPGWRRLASDTTEGVSTNCDLEDRHMKQSVTFLYRALRYGAWLATNSVQVLVVAGLAAISVTTAAVLSHAVSNSQAFF